MYAGLVAAGSDEEPDGCDECEEDDDGCDDTMKSGPWATFSPEKLAAGADDKGSRLCDAVDDGFGDGCAVYDEDAAAAIAAGDDPSPCCIEEGAANGTPDGCDEREIVVGVALLETAAGAMLKSHIT